MSELRVDSVKSKGGGAPNLPKGVTISGIATAVTLGATTIDVSNVNVSGVVTSATLNGPLLSTGTPTLGLGVTINSSGVAISGVATAGIVSATTLYGDGTNLTGLGATLAPLFYQPDPYDTGVLFPAGIGITFNQQVKAGTGNVTLSIANAGVAGTVVENFGVGSSVTISENRITIDPTADLSPNTIYHISYPSGCFTNNEGTDYVGTAYTFHARAYAYQLWGIGSYSNGRLGLNDQVHRSSPTQIPGTIWASVNDGGRVANFSAFKTDGTLWSWGYNFYGSLGVNGSAQRYSSPMQIPGATWAQASTHNYNGYATRTDGTLWSWGTNNNGMRGDNTTGPGSYVSSPIQIPGTSWATTEDCVNRGTCIRTDGTLWSWGYNWAGQLGIPGHPSTNYNTHKSSPTQVPGTTWAKVYSNMYGRFAIKTDGTLWAWGSNGVMGRLGLNQGGGTDFPSFSKGVSSPTQIPGTTWKQLNVGYDTAAATKTDGTLWAWGQNNVGQLGQNDRTLRSSPVQIPGTTWDRAAMGMQWGAALKTDGTLWIWGENTYGVLGQTQASSVKISSPVQVGSDTTWTDVAGAVVTLMATKRA